MLAARAGPGTMPRMSKPWAGVWGVGAALATACIAGAADPAPAVRNSAWVPTGYELTWHDEFDGPRLDETKWRHFMPDARRGAVFHRRTSAFIDPPGFLRIEARVEGTGYATGWLTTQPSFRQALGYFEVRAKMQSQKAHRAAAWLMPPALGNVPDSPAEAGAEIDLFSYAGDGQGDRGLGHGIHWNVYAGGRAITTNRAGVVSTNVAGPGRQAGGMADLEGLGLVSTGATFSSAFHVFGLLWTSNEYVFTIDGRETCRTSLGVSLVPQFVCLSVLPVNPDSPGFNDVKLPDGMDVDYVRVYALRTPSAAVSKPAPAAASAPEVPVAPSAAAPPPP